MKRICGRNVGGNGAFGNGFDAELRRENGGSGGVPARDVGGEGLIRLRIGWVQRNS